MTLLLEQEIEKTFETDSEVNHPEFTDNEDEETCSYYFNKRCPCLDKSFVTFVSNSSLVSPTYVHDNCLQYCPDRFGECLEYEILNLIDEFKFREGLEI